MEYWQKLLRRASASDRERIERAIEQILAGNLPTNTIKLQSTEIYRVRVGNWRIQFHYDKNIAVVDDIGRRNENTYK